MKPYDTIDNHGKKHAVQYLNEPKKVTKKVKREKRRKVREKGEMEHFFLRNAFIWRLPHNPSFKPN